MLISSDAFSSSLHHSQFKLIVFIIILGAGPEPSRFSSLPLLRACFLYTNLHLIGCPSQIQDLKRKSEANVLCA